MDVQKVQQIKALKQKFLSLTRGEREKISISFLKVKLGVNSVNELATVTNFLDGFEMEMTPENLDHMINFLHSKSHTLPEFIALEDSVTEVQGVSTSDLPEYDPLNADTLKDGFKPFKS